MPAGFLAINNENSVQIDENWKNYGLSQKTAVTITAYSTSPPNPTGWGGAPYQLIVAGSPQLLVACKASVLLPVKQWSYYDGTYWYLNWVFMRQLGEFGTVTETVWFYVFDAMDGTYSNIGLEVFNAAGVRVFHSDAPVMRLGGANVGIQPCNVPFYGDSGREYVPLILTAPFYTAYTGSAYRHFSHSNRSLGSYIHAEETAQINVGGSLAGSVNLPGLYAAIDVTGF